MSARKVLGYTRVSTQEQVTTGYGLEVQAKAIRDYARANGLRVARILSDEGQSGTNGLDARVGLAEALAIVERGEVAGIVVARMDRLARDLLLQETLMARMRQAGAEVISVSEPDMDSDDPTRVLVRQVLGSISQFERALIRGRMMAGRAAKVAGGGYGGGRPPFGWRARGQGTRARASRTGSNRVYSATSRQGTEQSSSCCPARGGRPSAKGRQSVVE